MSGSEVSNRPSAPNAGWYSPPGWHADPYAPSTMRWWDGDRWTTHVRPAPDAALGHEGRVPPTGAGTGPGGPGSTPSTAYSANGLKRWDGRVWTPVRRWDGQRWVRPKMDVTRPLLRVVVLVALATLLYAITDWIIAGQIADSCAGLPPAEYEACRNVHYEVSAYFVGPALLLLVLAVVVYLAMHPIVTSAERAGRIVGDSVNTGTMSLDAAEDAFQQWQHQSPASGRRFIRGYRTITTRPLGLDLPSSPGGTS